MKMNNKNIWIIAASISSFLLVILLTTFIYSSLQQKEEFALWPQDDSAALIAQNQAALKNANNKPAAEIHDFDSSRDYFEGSAKAKVKLIVYADFDCPFCKDFNPVLTALAPVFKKDLVIIYRNFPLDSHPLALGAANAWLCAAEQGKWREAKDALYDMANKTSEKYLAMASSLNLNKKQFADCLSSEKYHKQILADKAEAKAAGISGTPTSFLNDIILPGAYQIEDFTDSTGNTRKGLKSLINQQLAK